MAYNFLPSGRDQAFLLPPWVGTKSGSLPPDVVNEAGVVDYLDGRRFAVAVFTRGRPAGQLPPASQPRGAVGRVIGEVARLAVEHLATASS
jgi:beta-lactamase class A